jgi:predicted nucleotidyltransferase component of viral defense system
MRSWCLSDDALRQLLEVQEYFGLPTPALVEKDFQVVRALTAIAAADVAPFRLVFGGGTALSRAHRLIRRMSEDIDLKIIAASPPSRPALRHFRDTITNALLNAGFDFDPADPVQRNSSNQSRYTIFRLPYPAIAPGEGALRPEIQIETALWPLRLPSVTLPVVSFIAEALHRPPELPAIDCVCVTETAAEKLVALTRRVGAELAQGGASRDETLVRHLYDLHMIRSNYDPAEVALLASAIMQGDAAAYGNQFPAYREDPLRETLKAIESLSAGTGYADSYTKFHQSMIYGEQVDYASCIGTLNQLATALIDHTSDRSENV